MATLVPERRDHRWFALQVQPRHENTTASVLANKGYEVLAPLYRARRRRTDRFVELTLPLFPGYVFCRFDLRHRLSPVITTPGVVRIVGVGNRPAALADREMAAIQILVASGAAAEPWPYLEPGDIVRIEYGMLAGMEGTFIRTKKPDRLVISVTLLQRSVAIEIDRAWVSLCPSAATKSSPSTLYAQQL